MSALLLRYFNAESRENLVAQPLYLIRYFFTRADVGQNMENTELRVSDRVLILLVSDLWDAYRAAASGTAEDGQIDIGGGLRFLVEGVAILRDGLIRSPKNFKLKLSNLLNNLKQNINPSVYTA